ncbi:ABC transporter substrate binding protein [Desulfuromonas versatilis]|uniref:ABC transporter substrate binding protein n=1 Tax=Desulfuromonas versatilis TaxID=2802975 RepID=UPI001C860507|nr:ABC transporter substrate binding protein [Desulfuromonas versatilis]
MVKTYALPETPDARALEFWLQNEGVDSVIALGRQGLMAAQSLGDKRPVIIGALPIAPGSVSGISLSPEPAVLFRHLNELAPNVSRVHVVHTERNQWLIKKAETAARAHGLTLSTYQVNDLRDAVHKYRKILQSIRGPAEAIWLPLDNVTADDDVILPIVLQAAWEKEFVVFSSKPPHAQRGALFSVLPNHFGMGQQLAKVALNGPHPAGVAPLENLDIAVNLRTAFHLGLRFTPRQQENFDLVFPSR